ncbi:hypothetical protein E4U61_000226 [Claviceps capensis]|nr:hypothetical protein E4U61_000226 [Claviceps capensis]
MGIAKGSGSVLEDLDTVTSQPELFTSQHEFEDRWIHNHKVEQQINDAVAEGFDFYFNFLWGTPNDEPTRLRGQTPPAISNRWTCHPAESAARKGPRQRTTSTKQPGRGFTGRHEFLVSSGFPCSSSPGLDVPAS